MKKRSGEEPSHQGNIQAGWLLGPGGHDWVWPVSSSPRSSEVDMRRWELDCSRVSLPGGCMEPIILVRMWLKGWLL